MGRKRSINHHLPPRMAVKNGVYYHVSNGRPRKWTKLSDDLSEARIQWAHLEDLSGPIDDCTFAIASAKYEREIIPTKSPKTQKEYRRQLTTLNQVFGAMPLDAITPQHIKLFLTARQAKPGNRQEMDAKRPARVAANREKALFSTVFNHAREWGYTNAANPCVGVKGHREDGRDRYIDDPEYNAIYTHADEVLRDAMDLAYYTGQRVSDVLKMSRADVKDGAIWVAQNKTGARIRIVLEGELAEVVERILKRPRKIVTLQLLQLETLPLNYGSLRNRFVAAREKAGLPDIQFRDLRAKAATDLETTEEAQGLLGHSTITMTEHYRRKRAGRKVAPVGRRIVEK
jgi:integrase